MKRALYMLIAATSVLALGCNRSQTQSVGPVANKPLTITITYTAAVGTTPQQFKIELEDGRRISNKNHDTIKWKVKYNGPGTADVKIDAFRNTQDSSDKDPFNGSNQFDFFKVSGTEQTKDTQDTREKGDFKYTITVTLSNNAGVMTVDPVVIIDD